MNSAKSITLATFIGFLSFSCDYGSKPKGLLSENEMVNLLIRIHLAEAKVSNMYFSTDSSLYYYRTFEDSIFTQFATSKIMYDSSYKYYIKNADIMEQIYSRVVDSLSLRETLKNIN